MYITHLIQGYTYTKMIQEDYTFNKNTTLVSNYLDGETVRITSHSTSETAGLAYGYFNYPSNNTDAITIPETNEVVGVFCTNLDEGATSIYFGSYGDKHIIGYPGGPRCNDLQHTYDVTCILDEKEYNFVANAGTYYHTNGDASSLAKAIGYSTTMVLKFKLK